MPPGIIERAAEVPDALTLALAMGQRQRQRQESTSASASAPPARKCRTFDGNRREMRNRHAKRFGENENEKEKAELLGK